MSRRKYQSVASSERVLRQFIHDQYGHKPKPGVKTPEDAMEKHRALTLLVELAVHGVKYVKENGIKLRGRGFMDGEEE